MNRIMTRGINCIMGISLVLATAAVAGDLRRLPETGDEFKSQIEALIRPGNDAREAVRLLESDRFECRPLGGETHGIWCSRSDGSTLSSVVRRYQVVIEAKGNRITAIKTSIGLVGL